MTAKLFSYFLLAMSFLISEIVLFLLWRPNVLLNTIIFININLYLASFIILMTNFMFLTPTELFLVLSQMLQH